MVKPPPPDARVSQAEVVGIRACGDDGVILGVRPERELPPLAAGRFFMLRRTDGAGPLLPRPFSLYRQVEDRLEFLIKVIGCGTRSLAELRTGQEISVLGPLGNGWPALDGEGAPWVMLAGGVGIAPFYMGIEQALEPSREGRTRGEPGIHLLFGASTRGFLYDVESFRALGAALHTATDDGSEGFHGTVLELFESLRAEGVLPEAVRLLACGPEPMLEAVAELARERDLPCWLSLETRMACGVGICNGCVVPTRPEGSLGAWPNTMCCIDGPVFDSRAISLSTA